MPITAEERAEINRRNAQKSTGPRTEAGKAASRGNALKHGLTATKIAPVDAPGEPPGAYQARLDAWVADTKPRNVLEMAMIERACRSSWKLDRCARYEDAAAADREANPDPDPDRPNRRGEAEHLGALLMCALGFRSEYDGDGPPPSDPDPFDDAPRDADALAGFKEGVEWLLDAWAGVLPTLPDGDETGPPPEGAEVVVRRARRRALRLLGVPTGTPPPAQPLRQAGEAEVRRLRALLVGMPAQEADRADADLALFRPGPEAQLLLRYEAQAERELHRAVNTFLKLRKDPDLVPPPELPVTAAAAAAQAPPPARPAPRAEPRPAQNEARPPARPGRPAGVGTPPAGGHGPRPGGT